MSILFALLVCALLFVGCDEKVGVSYPDLKSAIKSGAVKKGWIPEFLLLDCSRIIEMHDLDANRGVLSCRVSENSLEALSGFGEVLRIEDMASIGPYFSTNVKWWPRDLRDKDFRRMESRGFVFMSFVSDAGTNRWYAAVNPRSRELYIWQ